jgi:hypothetical protein
MLLYYAALQGVLGTASSGIHNFSVDLAALFTSLLELAVLVMGIIVVSQAGGQGIQKPVRQLFFIVGIGALLGKGYSSIATGAMGLF